MKNIKNHPFFDEVYCLILCLISLLCWRFSSLAGMISILLIATLSLIVLNDFKYMIPCSLFFIFSNGNTFESTDFPWALFVCGIIFLIVVILYIIRHGFHISRFKSGKGVLLLSVSCVLPILWHNIILPGEEVLYLLYFTFLFYLLIYFIFVSSLKEDSFKFLCKSMGYMALLVSLECIWKVLLMHYSNPEESILNFYYKLGWGLCNEAGIMMCVGIPFIFINLIKTKKYSNIVICLLKLCFIMIGMLLTTSRGTILFGIIEVFLLFIWSSIFAKKRLVVCLTFISACILGIVGIQFLWGINNLVLKIKDNIFTNGLDDNGRFNLWKQAINLWNKDFVRMTFGSGIVAEYYYEFVGEIWKPVYVVYHSTLFETLAAFGNLGFAFLIIHFVEKYKQIFKLEKSIIGVMFIGYIIVDIYGLIDNTYTMYYYMVPLMIIMASLDNLPKENQNLIY